MNHKVNLFTGRILPALGLLAALVGLAVSIYQSINQPPEPAAGPPAATDNRPASTAAILTGADFPAADAAPGHQVGYPIPNFTLELADGSTVTAADLTDRSRPTFLFFWATT